MPLELGHQNIRDLTKELRELTGREIKSTAVLGAIAKSLGRRPDAMMHELKLEGEPTKAAGNLAPFEFPHDPRSNYDHIDGEAVMKSVLALISGYEDLLAGDRDLQALITDQGGWSVPKVLRTAAAFAFMKGIDPKTNYDAALVMQSLADYGFPSTGAITLVKKAPSPVYLARDLAEANGFRIWSADRDTLVFGRRLKEVELAGDDTATLDVTITADRGKSVDTGQDDRVWFAGFTYRDPTAEVAKPRRAPEPSNLQEAIAVALEFRRQAESVWTEIFNPHAVRKFLADWQSS